MRRNSVSRRFIWASTTSLRACSHPTLNEDENASKNLSDVFSRADTAEIIRVFDDVFQKRTFSLRSLFRDEQRKITNLILADSLESVRGGVSFHLREPGASDPVSA